MSLTGWWARLRTPRPPAAAAAVDPPPATRIPVAAAAAAATPAPAGTASTDAAAEPEKHGERHVRFFCWMVGRNAASGPEEAPAPVIPYMFERLDEVIASETLRAGLLPRAPHVVPQLMKTLRDENYSSADVAGRISRDVVLSAEVIRSATSTYRAKDDVEGEIDLARAVAMIGTAGLRRAIASVVLRPIFDAGGDTLSAKAATRIWKDADRKARLCATISSQLSLDPFDGYLAGLLHNSGWTAVLRAIDGFDDLLVADADLAHAAVVPELLRRRDALFGAIVGPWRLSPAIDALAAEVGRLGLDAARSPLGLALAEANRLAAWHALTPAGSRPGTGVSNWRELAKPVRDVYLTLSASA